MYVYIYTYIYAYMYIYVDIGSEKRVQRACGMNYIREVR